MAVAVHSATVSRAKSAAESGNVDLGDTWDAPEKYEQNDCLGTHEGDDSVASKPAYPVFKGGKLSRKGVIAAKSRAAQQGESGIESAADSILKIIDAKKAKEASRAGVFSLMCSASGLEGERVSTPTGMPSSINGSPCTYIWRRVAKPGTWTNRARGFTLNLSASAIDQLEKTGEAMLADGDEVPIVEDHRETSGATLGYVKGWKIQDGWLCSLSQIIGQRELEIFNKNYLSGGFQPDYTDSQGRSRGMAITHVATTPRPVIDGQELLAASQSTQNGIVLTMSGDTPMDGMTNLPCSQNDLDEMHEMVPGLKDQPIEGKLSHVVKHLKSMSGASSKKMSAAEIVADATLKAEVLTMSGATLIAEKLPQAAVEFVRRGVLSALEDGVASGKMTPDQAKTAGKILVGETGQPQTAFMSQAPDGTIPAIEQVKLMCSLTQDFRLSRATPVKRVDPDGRTQIDAAPYKSFQKSQSEKLAAPVL